MILESTKYRLEYNIKDMTFSLFHDSKIIEQGNYGHITQMLNILDEWIDDDWTTRQHPARGAADRIVEVFIEGSGY